MRQRFRRGINKKFIWFSDSQSSSFLFLFFAVEFSFQSLRQEKLAFRRKTLRGKQKELESLFLAKFAFCFPFGPLTKAAGAVLNIKGEGNMFIHSSDKCARVFGRAFSEFASTFPNKNKRIFFPHRCFLKVQINISGPNSFCFKAVKHM